MTPCRAEEASARAAEETRAARVAEEARVEHAAEERAQAEEAELLALEAEFLTPGGEHPATVFGVAHIAPDRAAPARTTQEEEQPVAEAAEATLPGVVSKTWTEADQEEMDNLNRLLT